jgi:hypothetical protein
MLKKFASKFAMDILPSVAATVIGAYVVNHYINKPADTPVAAAVSVATPAKSEDAAAPKAAETSSAIEAGAAKAARAADKATDKAAAEKVAPDKSSDKPAATASLPADKHWHQPLPRDKVAKPAAAAPAAAAPAPAATAAISPAPQPDPAPVQEERRDANDLARAAIERLRASSPTADAAARATETPRPDQPRIVAAPPIQPALPATASMQPLPPAVVYAAPGVTTGEAYYPGAAASTTAARPYDPRRPTPPADIPTHAEADAAAHGSSVADDVVSAARSVFQSVVPR